MELNKRDIEYELEFLIQDYEDKMRRRAASHHPVYFNENELHLVTLAKGILYLMKKETNEKFT